MTGIIREFLMLTIRADNTICTLRDQLCPARSNQPMRVGDTNRFVYPGIVFALDLHLAHYENNKEAEVRQVAYIAMCGNTSVWWAIEPEGKRWMNYKSVKPEEWVNTSNHDSCWRTDGMKMLTDWYFKAAETINKKLDTNVAPAMMSHHTSLGFCLANPWQFVSIEHAEDVSNGYRRKIVSIESREVQHG